MTKLSIIVPVYNVEPYLPVCIDTVLAQTYRDFELILIDDGSSDNSGAICDKYAEKDNRIIVRHQPNSGVSSARNLGIAIATGDYISFIDPDDTIEPQMYEVLINNAEKHNCDISACRLDVIRTNGSHHVIDLEESSLLSKEFVISNYFTDSAIKEFFYGPVNKIFKKSLIENIRFKNYQLGEDILFIFNVLQRAENIYLDTFVGYHYIHHENSAMRTPFSAKRLDYIYAAQEIVKISESSNKYALESARAWFYRHVLVTLRQIYISQIENQSKMVEFIKEYMPFIKENKKYLHQLESKRFLDYYILTICPSLFKHIYN